MTAEADSLEQGPRTLSHPYSRSPTYWAEVAALQAAQAGYVRRSWAYLACVLFLICAGLAAWLLSLTLGEPRRPAGEGLSAPQKALLGWHTRMLPRFQQNRLRMREIVELLEAHKAETGAYPFIEAKVIGPWGTVSSHPSFRARFGKTPKVGAYDTGGYLYLSDGTDYKLLSGSTQDCFVAQVEEPALVDKSRSTGGPIDCFYYGYWTSGAATW